MLLTLHARAEHTLSDRPRFTDPAAVELVSRLDYDFTLAGQDRLMADGVERLRRHRNVPGRRCEAAPNGRLE